MRGSPPSDGIEALPSRHGAWERLRAHGAAALLVGLWIALPAAVSAADEGGRSAPPAAPLIPARVAELSQLNSRVGALHQSGRDTEALPDARRMLALAERIYEPTNPMLAGNIAMLAKVLAALGADAEARPLYERALAVAEAGAAGAAASPLVQKVARMVLADALNNLALLLQDQGAFAEARPLLERALVLYEETTGADHPNTTAIRNNLGVLLSEQGAYEEARPHLERAHAAWERFHGPEHPDVAASLNNLAKVAQGGGALEQARTLFERSLATYERLLGADHPQVALVLNNLAALLLDLGEPGLARAMHERALAIRRQALGPDHPLVASSLGNLAVVLQAQGAVEEARARHLECLDLTERSLEAQLGALNQRGRLALVRSLRYRLSNWLSVAPEDQGSGLAQVLRSQGVVARMEAAERLLARRAPPAVQDRQAALRAAERRLAWLANQRPPPRDAAGLARWQEEYAATGARRDRLQREITELVPALRLALERRDLGLDDLLARLPPDAALVDTLRSRNRYLAWVVRPGRPPARVDLGDADALEDRCADLVHAIQQDDAPAVSRAGAALRAQLWNPLEPLLGADVRRLVLCPDAALAAVPFGALPGRGPGTTLLDDVALAHVMHPLDLVPSAGSQPTGAGALVVGGVDYDATPAAAATAPASSPAASGAAPGGARFEPLAATGAEARRIASLLGPETTALLLGSEASEAAMRRSCPGKRFVHVATHGFSRDDLMAGLRSRKLKDRWTSAAMERQLAAGHDPMLLSGLALAGANPRAGGGDDDGILTALEASYLDLDGCELVTLSACETAKGTAESGEGVLGLVSAFQMAGARHVIASLWKVDDEATRLLMEGLYERLLRAENPLSPADALREAALALRDRVEPDGTRRFAAPRYWAAFVAYGG